jgi:hypothetical protein
MSQVTSLTASVMSVIFSEGVVKKPLTSLTTFGPIHLSQSFFGVSLSRCASATGMRLSGGSSE